MTSLSQLARDREKSPDTHGTTACLVRMEQAPSVSGAYPGYPSGLPGILISQWLASVVSAIDPPRTRAWALEEIAQAYEGYYQNGMSRGQHNPAGCIRWLNIVDCGVLALSLSSDSRAVSTQLLELLGLPAAPAARVPAQLVASPAAQEPGPRYRGRAPSPLMGVERVPAAPAPAAGEAASAQSIVAEPSVSPVASVPFGPRPSSYTGPLPLVVRSDYHYHGGASGGGGGGGGGGVSPPASTAGSSVTTPDKDKEKKEMKPAERIAAATDAVLERHLQIAAELAEAHKLLIQGGRLRDAALQFAGECGRQPRGLRKFTSALGAAWRHVRGAPRKRDQKANAVANLLNAVSDWKHAVDVRYGRLADDYALLNREKLRLLNEIAVLNATVVGRDLQSASGRDFPPDDAKSFELRRQRLQELQEQVDACVLAIRRLGDVGIELERLWPSLDAAVRRLSADFDGSREDPRARVAQYFHRAGYRYPTPGVGPAPAPHPLPVQQYQPPAFPGGGMHVGNPLVVYQPPYRPAMAPYGAPPPPRGVVLPHAHPPQYSGVGHVGPWRVV